MNEANFPKPKRAEVKRQLLKEFNTERNDNYFWLKDKNNSEVIEYLKAENAYTSKLMASTKNLQKKIYAEIIGRIKEDDESYPVFNNAYYYYSRTEKGKQYRTFLRKKKSIDAKEKIIFDVNKMTKGHKAFIFAGYTV